MSDAPTIGVALNATQLTALINALQCTGLAEQRGGMEMEWRTAELVGTISQLRTARQVLADITPHGFRSTLAAMAQTQSAHEYRNGLEIAGAPAPWRVTESAEREGELRDAGGDLLHTGDAHQCVLIMLAVNTAAGFRAIDRGGALTWERATR